MYSEVEARRAPSCQARPNIAERESTRCHVQRLTHDAFSNLCRRSGVARVKPQDVSHHQPALRRSGDFGDAAGGIKVMRHGLLEQHCLACLEQSSCRLLVVGIGNRDNRRVNFRVFADRVHRLIRSNAEVRGDPLAGVAVCVDYRREPRERALGDDAGM